MDYTDHTVGFFTQYSFNHEHKFNLDAGLRADYLSEYGWFALPSVAVLIHAGEHLSFRINGGTGYKTPNLLEITESAINASVTYFPLAQDIEPEKSTGGTIEWNYRKIFGNDLTLFINQTFFYTQIEHAILPQYRRADYV
jgi:iron complex outermembrane receptor protein